ncbi:FAD-binding oxidoreductase [Streptomyces sp. NPDC051776]|uniref:FAD-binding oxidoreductase n=1 Tax=Streptomyces sp. NPDC051776 TaxID=3155414 RepID=UPI0034120CD9
MPGNRHARSVTHVDTAALAGLRDSFAGSLLTPGDPSYEVARTIFNAMIDLRPSVIAQCENPEDIARSIRFAREQDLEISVRGGGHSVSGMALTDGGIMIDLRRMHAAVVDPDARTVRIAGGATMSHLDRASEPYGLATTGGRVSTTGVGGFTLGGGSGWLDRKLGLAADNLLSVSLVTADGSTVDADEEENPELFWALHGGGGNFGVATSFTFRLHPLHVVTAMLLLWPPDAGPEVTRAYRDFLQSAPDEIGGGLIHLTGPDEDWVPPHLVNRLVCAVLVVYAGAEPEARTMAQPLLSLDHHASMIDEIPYADLQCMLDDPPGYRNYWTAEHLSSLPDEAIDLFCARAHDMIVPSPSQHVLFPQGGATARGNRDFPLPWRGAAWVAHPFGLWEAPADDARGKQWARDTRTDLKPWSTGAVFLNFIGDEGRERVVAGLGADHVDRLAAVKARYDPDNVFHRNHNIKPHAA